MGVSGINIKVIKEENKDCVSKGFSRVFLLNLGGQVDRTSADADHRAGRPSLRVSNT